MSGFDMTDDGGKASGAMLAIGELAVRIGVPTHVLRYWETRFPQLKPLQRSGRRRYYRAEDVALAERIHHLLHVQGFVPHRLCGFTVQGVIGDFVHVVVIVLFGT